MNMIEFYQGELDRLDYEFSRAASVAVKAHVRRRIVAIENVLVALIAREVDNGISF